MERIVKVFRHGTTIAELRKNENGFCAVLRKALFNLGAFSGNGREFQCHADSVTFVKVAELPNLLICRSAWPVLDCETAVDTHEHEKDRTLSWTHECKVKSYIWKTPGAMKPSIAVHKSCCVAKMNVIPWKLS